MRVIRYLYGSVNILNVALLTLIAATLIFAVVPLIRMKMKFTVPAAKTKAVSTVEATPATPRTPPSPLDYVMIGDNNLFHPERRIPPEKKAEKALPKPELVLYGTIIHDGVGLAYIEDKKAPKTTPGRGNRQQVIKKGDVLSGFVLKEIESDKIVLTRGEEVMTVHLSDEGKRRGAETGKGAAQPAAAARGPAAAPARTVPPGPAWSATPGGPAQGAPAPTPTRSLRNRQAFPNGAQPGAPQAAPQPQPTAAPAK